MFQLAYPIFFTIRSIAGRTTHLISFLENGSIEFQYRIPVVVCVAFVMIIRSNSFFLPPLESRQCTILYIFMIFMIFRYFSQSFLRTSLIDILLQLNGKLISLHVIRFEIKSRDITRS